MKPAMIRKEVKRIILQLKELKPYHFFDMNGRIEHAISDLMLLNNELNLHNFK